METSRTINPFYVYCSLVMLGDSYIPGALVLATSLRKVAAKYPLWCMVDTTVSAAGVDSLRRVFDKVITVELKTKKCIPMPSAKQREIYGAWINNSFTKWNIFDPEIMRDSITGRVVDKVLFIDADVCVLRNIDHLFDLPTPAATFSSPWSKPYIETKGVENLYGDLKHGSRVQLRDIRQSLNYRREKNLAIVCCASMVLIHPSESFRAAFERLLDRKLIYGYYGCVNGFDEQMLADVILEASSGAYHIHPIYQGYVGKSSWWKFSDKAHEPAVHHFYGDKPWNQTRTLWPECAVWWDMADKTAAEYDLGRWFKEPKCEARSPRSETKETK